MTARRTTRKAATVDIDVPDEAVIDDAPIVIDNTEVAAPATPNRKYFSHANCDHARKGEAGKAARAKCRAGIRAYLKAEAEWKESLAVDVAV